MPEFENIETGDKGMQNKQGPKKVTYQEILDKLRDVQNNFLLTSEDLCNIFDEKYKDSDVIQLLNEEGVALVDKNGKRIDPVEFAKVDPRTKEKHMRGILKSLGNNPVNLTEKILKEEKIVAALKAKGVDFKEMIESYKGKKE